MLGVRCFWSCLMLLSFSLSLVSCSDKSEPKPNSNANSAKPADPELPPPSGNSEPPLLDVVTPEQYAATIARHKGKVVLVDFWATWCGPCRNIFPHTVALHEQHKSKGFTAVSMSIDDAGNKEEALAFLTEQHAQFDNLMASTGSEDETYKNYEITGELIPHFKLYDRTGKLRYSFPDLNSKEKFDVKQIDQAIEVLLAETDK